MLEEKYKELLKEIEEKSALMEKELSNKEEGTAKIQEQMTEQLSTQEVDVKKQIEIYSEQAKLKKKEEEEMQKVLNEYKTRYNEFEKSVKQSKKTLGQYEKQISQMNKRIDSLQDTHDKQLLRVFKQSGLAPPAVEVQPRPETGGKKKKRNKGNV